MGFRKIYLGIIVIHKYLNMTFLEIEFEFFKHWDIFQTIFDIMRFTVNKFNKGLLKLAKTFHSYFIYYIIRVLAIFCYMIMLLNAVNLYKLHGIFKAKLFIMSLKNSRKVYYN